MASVGLRGHAGRSAWLLLLLIALLPACSGSGAPTRSPGQEGADSQDASAIAADAYVWGLPLVVTMRTLQTFAPGIGVNHLVAQQQLSDPSSRLVVAPNVDTLYEVAVLDLRDGPLVLSVPEIRDRYYTFQFLDVYTDAFAYVGTRATGGEAGSWVVAAPGWQGELPSGSRLISAPTPLVFLLGRFLVLNPDDLPAARAVMARVRLEPLAPGPAGPESAASLGAAPGAPQKAADAGAAFFDELGDVLATNPPASDADRAALARFAAIGVGPGLHPAGDGTADARAALAQGLAAGAARIEQERASTVSTVNGWESRRELGHYGGDFLLRATVAQAFWGANVPEEAVYLTSAEDGNGDAYSGARDYVLHFPAGALPPTRAFWSLTLYGPDMFLVENAAHRYAIGDRTPGLQANADGSLDLYLEQRAPAGHESNWLPTPAGPFLLMMRVYLPEPSVLDGTYQLPAVMPD